MPTTAPPERALSLSALENDIVASCYQHRLLTTAQILELHLPGRRPRWTQTVLAGLEGRGLLSRVRGRPPSHRALWFATDAGAAAAEAGGGVARGYRMTPELAAGPLQAHTLAVNDVGIAFVRAARAAGHDCSPLDWHHEVAHRIADRPGAGRGSDLVVADAVLYYTLREEAGEEAVLTRFVEVDRTTMGVAQAEAKLRAYAACYRYEGRGGSWRARYLAFPKVLVVLTGRPRPELERRRGTLSRLCRLDPALTGLGAELGISLVLGEDLDRCGPLAPVFHRPAGPDGGLDLLGRPA